LEKYPEIDVVKSLFAFPSKALAQHDNWIASRPSNSHNGDFAQIMEIILANPLSFL